MYATGIRVSELIGANVEDINLRMGVYNMRGRPQQSQDSAPGKTCPRGS